MFVLWGEFMGAIISYGLKDCNHIVMVPVISSFDTSGKIMPLYIRLEGEQYKIYNPILKDSNMSILSFQCEVMDCDRVKPITLHYHIKEHTWSIPA